MGSLSIERFCFAMLPLASIVLPVSPIFAQSLGNPIIPPPRAPTPVPSPLPPPEELLPPSPVPIPPPEIPAGIPDKIRVRRFIFEGNTAFTDDELGEITRPFTNRSLSFSELLQARSAITKFYVDSGYITSGAFIPPQTIENGAVKIKIVEGTLEDIRVTVQGRLNPEYIRGRIAIATGKPLNINRLLEALQVLRLDPVISRLSAELAVGTRPGTNLLDVTVEVADTLTGSVILDNGRSTAVGSFRRGVRVEEGNLTGNGDRLRAWYLNTDGSNDWNISYTLPVNAYDGSIGIEYRNVSSEVIQSPLDRLDISSDYQDVVLSFRQPVTRSPDGELAFGTILEYQRSQSRFLGGRPFVVSGTDDDGVTSVSTFRFFQEWTGRGRQDVVFLRSEFSFGLDILGATTPFDSQVNENAPEPNYFLWRGQGQWVRLLAPDTLFILRGNVQIADRPLVSLEQFALGGIYSVRGYQQNFLLSDNGVFASAEFRLPIFRAPRQEQLVQIVPFVDTGFAWNRAGVENPDPNTIVSVGLGLNWQWGKYVNARVDWGYPLIRSGSLNDTWQDSGFSFSIIISPF